MSKGSRPRPIQVSNEEYANRWDAIFGVHREEKPASADNEVIESDKKEEHDNS